MKVKEKPVVVTGDLEKESSIPVEIKMEDKKTSKKRDSSIELIRIFACLTVVITHLSLNVFNEYYSQVDWSRLFEKCFFTDGVPLFFMIMGFFLVNGRSYKKIWKNTIKKILIPVLIFVLFAQVFYMFIINKENLSWCFQNAIINLNIQGIFKTIFTGDVTHINSLCAHLWYIVSYVKITIWIPILWLICKDDENAKFARRIIIGFGIIAKVINDIQKFVTLPIGPVNVFEMVDIDILYVLLGYEMFTYKDKIKNNKKACLISAIIWVIVNVLRYKIEMQYMVINSFYDIVGRANFIEWKFSSLNIISGIAIFIVLYSFEIKNEKLTKIINWIADKTFGIYLVHYLLLAKIDLYKFDKIGTLVNELIYLVVGTILIFTASLLIVCLLRKIKELFFKAYEKIINALRKTA